ncbi:MULTISPECIES: hypothetical protein [unclassified Curtobacterium]|uniref:electron transfer flavoprotein subunit beta/FixA family protein n=1 Tax=unclassified Curtobacterium TaxID=257496 RepID=UPI000DA90AB2|nr:MULTISPECIES: hypothetical protein [unclassified Curtobacterium]PZE24148.1 hypothetical protein DEI86_12840 [Curtobacterium sp. MCBD17_028]PZE71542.1 hypothetical protein DEI82_15535 [Curtobacterium sp. MCBD17_019]
MNVLVLVKDIDAPGGTAMSGVDPFAVAAAVALAGPTPVTAVTLGPDRSVASLREALALGARRAVHVLDPHGACDLATAAHRLAAVITRIRPDVVLLGREATDTRSGVLAAMLAGVLGWPLLAAADRISATGSTRPGGPTPARTALTARQRTDTATHLVSAPLPAVVSVAEYGAEVGPLEAADLRRATTTPVERWHADDLGVGPTVPAWHEVERVPRPVVRRAGRRVAGHDEAAVLALFASLGLAPAVAAVPA